MPLPEVADEHFVQPPAEHTNKRIPKLNGEPERPEKQPHRQNPILPGIELELAFPNPHRVFVERSQVEDRPEVLGAWAARADKITEQVQVKNGVMDAQYGGAIGGVVNAVVRSGTNSFHGQAGFYYNNDAMSAPAFPRKPRSFTS